MPLEATVTTIADLVATDPLDTDVAQQGAGHIRNTLFNILKFLYSLTISHASFNNKLGKRELQHSFQQT